MHWNRNVGCVLLVALFGFHAISAWPAPGFTWGVDDQFLFQVDGLTLIEGDHDDSDVAGFVQMIYLGSDGEYNGLTLNGDGKGTVGTNEVIATSWTGRNIIFLEDPDGWFDETDQVTYETENKSFIIRFFEQPSPNYGAGLIPQTGYYGISSVFQGTDGETPDEFRISETVAATHVVPEPGAAVLVLLGAGAARGLRRRQRG